MLTWLSLPLGQSSISFLLIRQASSSTARWEHWESPKNLPMKNPVSLLIFCTCIAKCSTKKLKMSTLVYLVCMTCPTSALLFHVSSLYSLVSTEPCTIEPFIRIRLQLPSGERLQRTFSATQELSEVWGWEGAVKRSVAGMCAKAWVTLRQRQSQ